MNKKQMRCEWLNCATHAVGLLIGILFLILFISNTTLADAGLFRAFIIYGLSFILLYLASTLYHGIQYEQVKARLRFVDHSAIFIFIAGSYTPLIVYLFDGIAKTLLLGLVWILAIGGFFLKIAIFGQYDKYEKALLAFYLGMGWLAIFFIRPLLLQTSLPFIALVALGGILYSLGTIFYRRHYNPSQHVIWHLFVLAASCCHLWAMCHYLL